MTMDKTPHSPSAAANPALPSSGAVRASAAKARQLTVAMPKGRIMKEAAEIFARAGYDLSPVFDESRRLIYDCDPLRLLILRSSDVPTYVAYGAADIGIAGSDVLDEQRRDLYEPLDLGIGRCRMIVAEPSGYPVDARSQLHVRIGTKYPRITRSYLDQRGLTAEVIKLSGAIELGPLTGLCDRIVDITQTGETLRQNGLAVVDTIAEISSRLVINPASTKLREAEISDLVDQLAKVIDVHH